MARPRKEKSIVDDSVEQIDEVKEQSPKKESLIIASSPEKDSKLENKAKLSKFIEEETKLVRGRFRNFETPGASSRIQVLKYKGVPMFDKTMMDGEMYEIPLYVARHLNGVDKTAEHIGGKVGTCSYIVHGFKSSDGNLQPSTLSDGGIPVPIVGVTKRVRRFGFDSLEFDTQD